MRVHELAKKLGVASKDLIADLKAQGVDVKSHMSVIEDSVAEKFSKPTEKAPKTEEKPAAQPAEPEKKSEPPKVEKAPEPKVEKKEEPVATKPAPEKKPEPPKEVVKPKPTPAPPVSSGVKIEFPITVGNFAAATDKKVAVVIKTLMGIGVFANVNQLLNEEIGTALAEALDVQIEKVADAEDTLVKDALSDENDANMVLRPPVVTMMGHVDHGKTSLLDAIRSSNVAGGERGAITQHIGAYGVDVLDKGHVTFLDTPGHEAFTAMRARGANVTDVVVIVIAADDGIMPQTVEAIDHAREAGCPIVVALNKIDLPTANLDKVYGELQKIDLAPEEWGGKTICVKVSAKTGEGIDELLEMLILESEILELKANPTGSAIGTIIEGHLSKGSGPVATVLVQNGTLRHGDIVIAGQHMGRIRYMKNDLGKNVKEAGPSYAVEISGLSGVPEAGETLLAAKDEKTAKKITEKKRLEIREREIHAAGKHMSLENVYEKISEGSFKELKLIVKSDTQGSVEALRDSLEKLSTDLCRVHMIHGAVGGINESDVVLAAASDAIIIGFHVKADPKAAALCEREGVDLHYYGIIYEAVENVRQAMEGILDPTLEEVIDGHLEVRQVFKSSKAGTIGGAMVKKGKLTRSQKVRLIRDSVVIFEGNLSSLKRFKDDVKEVKEGFECGVSFQGFNDIREGDIVEGYHIEKIATKL